MLLEEKSNQLMELNDELDKIKVSKEMLEADLLEHEQDEEKIAELSATNAELSATNAQLQTKVEELQGELNQYKQDYECAKCKVEELTETNSELQRKLSDLDQKLLKQREDRQQTTSKIDDLTERNSELEEKLCDMDLELQAVKHRDDVCQELENANKELTESKEFLEKENTVLQEQLQKYESMCNEKESLANDALGKIELELKETKEACNKASETVKNLNSEVETLQEEKSQLHEKLTSKKAEVERLTSMCEEHLTNINSLESVVKKLQTEGRQLVGDIQEKTSGIECIEKEVETLRREMAEKNETQERMSHELAQNVEMCEEQQKQLEKLQNELAEKQSQLTETCSQVDHLEKVSKEMQERYSELEMKFDEQGSEQARELIVQVQNREKELEVMADDNKKLQDQVTSLVKQGTELSEAKTKIAELKSSLHMHQTLHEKAKAEKDMLSETNQKIVNEQTELRLCLSEKERTVEELNSRLVELEGRVQSDSERIIRAEEVLVQRAEKMDCDSSVKSSSSEDGRRTRDVDCQCSLGNVCDSVSPSSCDSDCAFGSASECLTDSKSSKKRHHSENTCKLYDRGLDADRKIRKMSSQLQEQEELSRKLKQELSDCRGRIEDLEQTNKQLEDQLGQSKSGDISPTIHKELATVSIVHLLKK